MNLKVNSITHKPDYNDGNSLVINYTDSAGKGRIRFILHPDIEPQHTEVLLIQLSAAYEGNIYPKSREEMKIIIAGELEKLYKTFELRPLLKTRAQATERGGVVVSRVIAADRPTNTYLECLARHCGQKKSCSVSVRLKLNDKQRQDLKDIALAIIADTSFSNVNKVRKVLEEIVELFRDLHDIEKVKDNRRGVISKLAKVETRSEPLSNIRIYGPYVYLLNDVINCVVRLSFGSSSDCFYNAVKGLGIHKDEIKDDTVKELVRSRADAFYDEIKRKLKELTVDNTKDFSFKSEITAEGKSAINIDHHLLINAAFKDIPPYRHSDYLVSALVSQGR